MPKTVKAEFNAEKKAGSLSDLQLWLDGECKKLDDKQGDAHEFHKWWWHHVLRRGRPRPSGRGRFFQEDHDDDG